MHNYVVFWRGKRAELQATSSFDAQKRAAALWKVKREWEITVVYADAPVNTAAL